MAIENAVIYVLTELPALVIAKVLQRCFVWTPRRADTVASLILMGVGFGACLLVVRGLLRRVGGAYCSRYHWGQR